MNENDPANLPSPIPASPDSALPPPRLKPRSFIGWRKKLFACNPFYPVSAALLLYGCYRVSIDAPLFNVETARLWFNFTSVQFYEILLVSTAIFLVRRKLWYDSTLLLGLENLLVFVPFILISQAALTELKMAVAMCLAGAALVVVRFRSVKKHFRQLNLPDRSLEIGSILLAVNVALPLIYRHFGQTKIGVHIDAGAAYEMNEFTWLLILPATLALVNFLPRPRPIGELLPQNRWLPLGFFSLWITVTWLHLYGLDYIYQFDLRGELIAPTAWVLAWTLFLQVPTRSIVGKSALSLLPLFVPLFSISPSGAKTFLILTTLISAVTASSAGLTAITAWRAIWPLPRRFWPLAACLTIGSNQSFTDQAGPNALVRDQLPI
jgi:hypothetical protein